MNRADTEKSHRGLAGFLVLAGVIPLIWPGDAPWINDEPILIEAAFRSKEQGT